MSILSNTELAAISGTPDVIESPCICCGGTKMDPAGDENGGGECPLCCREYDQPWWFDDTERESFEQYHGQLPF